MAIFNLSMDLPKKQCNFLFFYFFFGMKITSAKDGKVTRLPLPLPLVSQPSQLRSPETSEVQVEDDIKPEVK